MNYKDVNPGDPVTFTSKSGRSCQAIIVTMIENSYTKVIIRDDDRGEGFDPISQRYKGVKSKGSWKRGQNHDYGIEIQTHIKNLTPVNND